MPTEKCDRCGVLGHDRRTLEMACFYDMAELGIPFVERERFFTLRVCKGCRGDWMHAIAQWFRSPPSDVARFNNDADYHFEENTLALIVSELEAKSRDIEGLKQRFEAALVTARSELDQRRNLGAQLAERDPSTPRDR